MTLRLCCSLIVLGLATPVAGWAQCARSRPGDPFYGVSGVPMVAQGESRILLVCTVKAPSLDSIRFTPAEGLSVSKIEEIAVPDSMAKRGMRAGKDRHIFLITVRAAPDAPAGGRTFLPVYAGSQKEKPDSLYVATHLPLLLDAAVTPGEKGKYAFTVVVQDSLHDWLGAERRNWPPIVVMMDCEGGGFVNGNLMTVSSLYLAPIDSVQQVDANTTRAFSSWHNRSRCSGTVVARDAQGNESPVRKTLYFVKQ